MNNFPKDLQQKNFYQTVKKLQNFPGWEVLEDNNLMALKAPTILPLINFIWGESTIENINKIKKFYGKQAFHWQLPSRELEVSPEFSEQLLLDQGCTGPDLNIEMGIFLDNYQPKNISANIRVEQVITDIQLDLWAQTASETFEFSAEDLKDFFLPFIKYLGNIPFLGFYDNEPAATSLVACENDVAGVHAMSTRKEFRRKGLGVAMTQACLDYAKNKNFSKAVLYASSMGKPLYESVGFKITQILREYYYKAQK